MGSHSSVAFFGYASLTGGSYPDTDAHFLGDSGEKRRVLSKGKDCRPGVFGERKHRVLNRLPEKRVG